MKRRNQVLKLLKVWQASGFGQFLEAVASFFSKMVNFYSQDAEFCCFSIFIGTREIHIAMEVPCLSLPSMIQNPAHSGCSETLFRICQTLAFYRLEHIKIGVESEGLWSQVAPRLFLVPGIHSYCYTVQLSHSIPEHKGFYFPLAAWIVRKEIWGQSNVFLVNYVCQLFTLIYKPSEMEVSFQGTSVTICENTFCMQGNGKKGNSTHTEKHPSPVQKNRKTER